jgi:membrane-bound lytic murein transglycosylase B
MRATSSAVAGVFAASLLLSVPPATAAPGNRPDMPLVEVTRAAPVSPRPLLRPAAETPRIVPVTATQSNLGFAAWLDGFDRRARAAGVDDATLRAALSGIRYNTDVIQKDRNQAEFSKAMWEYLDSAVSATRINNGAQALRDNQAVLERIEAQYGVEKEVVVAVWGLESAYGSYRGRTEIIEALATLAYDGRRGAFFEEQLIAALQIVQAGDVAPAGMTGSWAGAMGHTQFIPTSYLAYAVDFDGDGKRDIWSDDPTDALASTAAYLARFGWTAGQPWGTEVTLPEDFDYSLADGRTLPVADWAAMGVSGPDMADHGLAEILLPAGARGPALMIFGNFRVIERYNTADSYVIAIGHLSDRLQGAPAFRSDWPRDERALLFAERKELQSRLTSAGYSTSGVDGRIGPNTIDAIRRYQVASGLTPDGYASLGLLHRLR